MDDLIARLERASEGSRELDAEIARSIGLRDVHHDGDESVGVRADWFYATGKDADGGPWEPVPNYTFSLDAALSLVPEGCCVDIRRFDDGQGGNVAVRASDATPDEADDELFVEEYHATSVYLALCIAALRARATAKVSEAAGVS